MLSSQSWTGGLVKVVGRSHLDALMPLLHLQEGSSSVREKPGVQGVVLQAGREVTGGSREVSGLEPGTRACNQYCNITSDFLFVSLYLLSSGAFLPAFLEIMLSVKS